MKYYVRVGDENQGPFSTDELRKRGLDAGEYVWRDGMGDWCRAGELPELAGLLTSSAASVADQQHGFDPASPYASPKTHSDYSEYMGYGAGQHRPFPHSGYGIASTILGCGTLVALFAGFMAVGLMQQQNPNIDPNSSPTIMVLSLSICFGGPLFHLIGLVLGLIGVFQPDRQKLFGVMGTVINALVVFGMLALVLLGVFIAIAAQQ